MRFFLLFILFLGLPWQASVYAASGPDVPPMPIRPDLNNFPSLQRGAKIYVNYCLGCHELGYHRYERTANDLKIPHQIFEENLIFTGQKIGALMINAMTHKQSKQWFGTPPPDLTLITRSRSPSWLYAYLHGFYDDPTRPFGTNNVVMPGVGMPNILEELQGRRDKKCVMQPALTPAGWERRDPVNSQEPILTEVCDVLVTREGTNLISEQQFDTLVYDLVNFLHYTSEPSRKDREELGIYVLLFLTILFVLAYLLNREYWKDVHRPKKGNKAE